MKQGYIFFFAALFVFAFAAHTSAGMQSASFRITSTVLSAGGSPMSSDSFRADSTLGQPSPLMDPLAPPQSAHYDLFPGFWYALGALGPCFGDLDYDGDMDGLDLQAFIMTFGTSSGDPDFNPDADYEGNGIIDEDDLEEFAKVFGTESCP